MPAMPDSSPTVDASSEPLRFRRTRIAVSVFSVVLTVALVVLWVRSYWRFDEIVWTSETRTFAISSSQGKLSTETINDRVLLPLGWSRVSFRDSDSDDEPKTLLGFGWHKENGSITAVLPLWFLALLSAAIAWLPGRRFSLRNMLITTTLVAVLLGLDVWFAR
jgi:hypothetical protein